MARGPASFFGFRSGERKAPGACLVFFFFLAQTFVAWGWVGDFRDGGCLRVRHGSILRCLHMVGKLQLFTVEFVCRKCLYQSTLLKAKCFIKKI